MPEVIFGSFILSFWKSAHFLKHYFTMVAQTEKTVFKVSCLYVKFYKIIKGVQYRKWQIHSFATKKLLKNYLVDFYRVSSKKMFCNSCFNLLCFWLKCFFFLELHTLNVNFILIAHHYLIFLFSVCQFVPLNPNMN